MATSKMYFYVTRFPGDPNVAMFNSHCQNVILLDKMKQNLNLLEFDIIDLINVQTKESYMLHTNPTGYANEVLNTGGEYLVCSVKYERTKVDEEELKKKKKKLPDNVIDGYEVKIVFESADLLHPDSIDFSKIVPYNPTGRKSRNNKK